MPNKKEEDRYSVLRQVGLLTTIPILLAVAPIIGYLMGRFLDGKLGTTPILGVVFLILGFVAAARQIARIIKLSEKPEKKKPNRTDGP